MVEVEAHAAAGSADRPRMQFRRRGRRGRTRGTSSRETEPQGPHRTRHQSARLPRMVHGTSTGPGDRVETVASLPGERVMFKNRVSSLSLFSHADGTADARHHRICRVRAERSAAFSTALACLKKKLLVVSGDCHAERYFAKHLEIQRRSHSLQNGFRLASPFLL